MVGVGMLMLLIAVVGLYQFIRRKEITKPVAISMVAMTFSGWVATVSGWYVTEIGRQPWLVKDVLLTKDAVADIPVPFLNISLFSYLSIYAVLLTAYISTVFYLASVETKKSKEPK